MGTLRDGRALLLAGLVAVALTGALRIGETRAEDPLVVSPEVPKKPCDSSSVWQPLQLKIVSLTGPK